MASQSAELKLSTSIEHGGKEIGSLTIRRPIVADMLAAQKVSTNEPERELNLIAVLTGLPRAAIEKLDMRDYMALQRKLAEFMKP
jgi:Phage tail assembly chaperone proteins, E, or 41 or 14